MIRSHRDLQVWHKAMALARTTYSLTKHFPKEETYGLVQQMRRAAVSISSNIAEGYGRNSTLDYMRFLSISIGSLAELETQILLAQDFGYCSPDDSSKIQEQVQELEKMLKSLRTSLREKVPA